MDALRRIRGVTGDQGGVSAHEPHMSGSGIEPIHILAFKGDGRSLVFEFDRMQGQLPARKVSSTRRPLA